MADVFISYARDDQAVARRVAKVLQQLGLEPWWDADLPAHRDYSEIIEQHLDEAKAVLVLWSKSAARSQWVRAEADFARSRNKLVQAQLDGSIPPMPFNQIQCANLQGWRGASTHSGWMKLTSSISTLLAGDQPPRPLAPRASTMTERLQPYRWWVAACLALLVLAAGWFAYGYREPSKTRPVVAVLPFKSLDARDESLAAGMWEDTREAIGRNPQLVVLGSNSAEELATKGSRGSRNAADYLVNGSIRTAGDRIRVSTALVRTSDGAQLWSDSFDRRLDDVFALQSDIAAQIEGRIRGRLAANGGVKPENIATTADVYALYNDARVKVRKHDPTPGSAAAAWNRLRQVVKLDPNFAPGWATLSVATLAIRDSDVSFSTHDAAEAYARRAIELAPNLAAGHSALALALKFRGPVAKAEARRAVALDPNDYEAVLWLGLAEYEDGRNKEALDLFSRAVDIEPLWWPAILTKLGLLLETGDYVAARQELNRLERLGAHDLAAMAGVLTAYSQGDLSKAADIGIRFWNSSEPDERGPISVVMWRLMLQLGHSDEANTFSKLPKMGEYFLANDPRGLAIVEAMHLSPRKFFSMMPLPATAGRVYVMGGKSARLAQIYKELGVSPDEFHQLVGPGEPFLLVAPLVAVALQRTGDSDAAARLLAFAENEAKTGPHRNSSTQRQLLARIYAAQGRRDEALATLASAVRRGWLPLPPELLTDLDLDPAFSALHGDPRFERLRQEVLGTIRRERAELGVVSLR